MPGIAVRALWTNDFPSSCVRPVFLIDSAGFLVEQIVTHGVAQRVAETSPNVPQANWCQSLLTAFSDGAAPSLLFRSPCVFSLRAALARPRDFVDPLLLAMVRAGRGGGLMWCSRTRPTRIPRPESRCAG